METPALDPEMVQLSFYSYGFQYYVAGRFAVIAQLSPVAANLLHHAIEMLLKGELVHLEEKQRRDMGHDLTKLWPAYKKQMAVEDTLVSFDPIIEKLNKFEEIRYPDEMPSTSLRCRFALEKAAETETRRPSKRWTQRSRCTSYFSATSMHLWQRSWKSAR